MIFVVIFCTSFYCFHNWSIEKIFSFVLAMIKNYRQECGKVLKWIKNTFTCCPCKHPVCMNIMKNAIYNSSPTLGSVDKADICSIYQPHCVSGHAPVTAQYCFTVFPELLSWPRCGSVVYLQLFLDYLSPISFLSFCVIYFSRSVTYQIRPEIRW